MEKYAKRVNIHKYVLKFIVVGDSSVGKSNLLLQFTDGNFNETHDLTIGVEFGIKNVSYQNTTYRIQVWDTAGQEAFQAITTSYYRGSAGCLLVYDITNRQSFNNIKSWLDTVKEFCDPKMTIALVGNKTDLNENREVGREEGEKFANDNGILFLETSAKTGNNVDEVYLTVVKHIKEKIDNQEIKLDPGEDRIMIRSDENKGSKYCCWF